MFKSLIRKLRNQSPAHKYPRFARFMTADLWDWDVEMFQKTNRQRTYFTRKSTAVLCSVNHRISNLDPSKIPQNNKLAHWSGIAQGQRLGQGGMGGTMGVLGEACALQSLDLKAERAQDRTKWKAFLWGTAQPVLAWKNGRQTDDDEWLCIISY